MSGRPTDDHDEPPWEQPGAFRLDCEPHRGGLLSALGTISLVLGVLSLFCFPLCVTGLTFGLPAWVLAYRDLARMRAGLMDPTGREQTHAALGQARAGVVLSVLGAAGLFGGWFLCQ
jgi:hypothetical protein